MTKRRVQLVAPRSGAIVASLARAAPANAMMMFAGAALSGAYLATKFSRRKLPL